MTEALPISGSIIDLGPANRTAVKRLANEVTTMIREGKLPQESPFINDIATRITGRDKQDFRMIITGDTGDGKSYTALYLAPRLARRISEIIGGSPEDYFSLQNCALLEDTDGINKVLKIAKKYQVIIIDDAGVAVGSRDFATLENRNFNKLLATCRTMRWCLIITVPLMSHIDKQIRQLVYIHAKIFKSFHEGGFNILKIGKVKVLQNRSDKPIYPRLAYDNHKIDFWVALSPDPELARDYDLGRDAAAQRLIQESITGEEEARLSPRQQRWNQIVKECYDTVKSMKGTSVSSIAIECNISERQVRKLQGMIRQEEKAGKKP